MFKATRSSDLFNLLQSAFLKTGGEGGRQITFLENGSFTVRVLQLFQSLE